MISSPALSLSFIWFAQHWPKWQRPGVILNKNDETKVFLYFPYCWKRPHYFMDWVKSGSLLCVNFPFTYSNGLCFELSMFPSGRWTALMHLICLLSINLDIFWQIVSWYLVFFLNQRESSIFCSSEFALPVSLLEQFFCFGQRFVFKRRL